MNKIIKIIDRTEYIVKPRKISFWKRLISSKKHDLYSYTYIVLVANMDSLSTGSVILAKDGSKYMVTSIHPDRIVTFESLIKSTTRNTGNIFGEFILLKQ